MHYGFPSLLQQQRKLLEAAPLLPQVAFFSNHFAIPNGHGVARYTRKAFEHLRNECKDWNILPVACWSGHPAQVTAELKSAMNFQVLPWGRKITPLAWTFLNAPPIETWLPGQTDILHITSLGYPVATRLPLVVTIHDMGPFTHPQYFKNVNKWLLEKSLSQAVKDAQIIICVSKATQNELCAYTGVNREKTKVVYEGVDRSLFKDSGSPGDCPSLTGPDMDTPFLLCVGQMNPRKNLGRVIDAFERIAPKISHHLAIVGAGGWDKDEIIQRIRGSAFRERVHDLGYVSEERLHALYQTADAYVHPSLLEGFGLTVLEAMAAGCPVLTSRVSSLPEIAGDAALQVDPGDTDEIAASLLRLCRDSSLRERLRKKGRKRAAQFTWENCAKDIHRIYEEIC